MRSEKGERSGVLIIAVNLLLTMCMIAIFVLYTANYNEKIREQNINDIGNINRASANISSSLFMDQQRAVLDDIKYIDAGKMSYDEAVAYICDSNSGHDIQYELVGADGRGYLAQRGPDGFIHVDYTHTDYAALRQIFSTASGSGTVGCTPEFTDSYSASRSFALYSYLTLDDGGGDDIYTLMAVFNSSDFAGLIELDGGYDNMSCVLTNEQGDYIFGSVEFKSDNLFKYFYVFNDLSLDEKTALQSDLTSEDQSIFYFKDSTGRDCVFIASPVTGASWYCVTSVPVASFRGEGRDLRFTFSIAFLLIAMMAFNIIWMRRANLNLKRSVVKEKEAGRAKTDFLSRMSHDIRTPLNVIIGSTILATREDNPPATKKYLTDIDQSGKFLLSLVNDILDLNKVENGRMELHPVPYSFIQFRAAISAIISPLCRDKDIVFKITGSDDTPSYLLDPTRTEQIFFNILSNSVKFTEPGGHILLDCKAELHEDGNDILSFTASDDGCGMTKEFQEHMFEAFSQERDGDSKTGTGLGLAIVRNLVDLMGGTIDADSEPGKGTAFFITIPAQRAPQDAVVPSSGATDPDLTAAGSRSRLAGKKVLLFEDNAINAEIARTLLSDAGITTEHAVNGRDGVEIFRASAPFSFDAILMDLRMPVMNGLEASRAIRALDRADAAVVPIIAMTANAYDEDIQNCLDAGMNAHLSKPIDPDKLLTVLAKETASCEKKKDSAAQ